MPVEQKHVNSLSTLHGGVISSLVDVGGSLAIAAKRQIEYTGVSTDLSVSFVSSGKLGETIK